MNKTQKVVLVIAFLGGSFLLGSPAIRTDQGTDAGKKLEYARDRILVKFKKGASTSVGLSMVRSFPSIRTEVLRIPPGESAQAWVQKLSRDPRVEYAELDFKRTIATIPNDPQFGELWGLRNTGQTGGTPGADIDASEAWNLTTGLRGVIVAVIDTGIDYTHPDLAANMWTNSGEIPGNGIDDDNDGYVDDIHGINAITGSGDAMDDHYHGTHCAGTIGAVGNNSLGVVGVCWKVRLMALKFLDSLGSGYTSDAIACIEYAISKGANVMSNSWGGGGFDQSLKDAIDAARAAGILFIAAAGNSHASTDNSYFYPATYDCNNIISVAATDENDNLASFSNYGWFSVDVAAPGVSILSCQPGGFYQYLSGTSMATPHVAGLAALLKAYNSAWTWQEIKGRILAGTVHLDSLDDMTLTEGRINACNSLLADLSLPHIFNIHLQSASPGATVKVSGYGFGSTQGAGRVEFSNGQQAAVNSWCDSQIVCIVPDQAQTGNVVVTNSSGQTSNGVPFLVTVPFYTESQISNEFTGGGTAQGWRADDGAWSYTLPFDLTYFGQTYPAGTPIYISSNGYIDLVERSAFCYNNEDRLASRILIAPMFLDLMTNGTAQAGEDIYIASDGSRVIIRWCAETFSYAQPVNFEVVLNADGTIKFNYGPENFDCRSPWAPGPTIGLSDAYNGYAYKLSVYNAQTNLNGVDTVLFTPLQRMAIVTTAAVTNITTTSADCGGNVVSDGGNPVTDRGVCWRTSGSPTIADSHTHDGTGTGVFMSHLTGLAADMLYHVRAYATNSVGTSYGGDLTFAASLGTFTVTAPASGAQWSRGFTHTIAWAEGTTTSPWVRIQLYRGNLKAKVISNRTSNEGTYSWYIPPTQALATNYRIKVTAGDNQATSTSEFFSIIKPTIAITSPAAGVVWIRGTVHDITWNKDGDQDDRVVIQLFKGTTRKPDIAANAANNGRWSWSIPFTLTSGTNYSIKIVTSDKKVVGKSKRFTIN